MEIAAIRIMAELASSSLKDHNESSDKCKVKRHVSHEEDHLKTEETQCTWDEEMDSGDSDESDNDVSDSEDYVPESHEDSNNSSDADVELSTLEEEEGIQIVSKECGGSKFYKLRFDDIEEKKKHYLLELQADDEPEEISSDDEKKETSDKGEPMSDRVTKPQFSGYRSLLMNLGEANYNSDDNDDDFNPMYCGDTLSDEDDCNGNSSEDGHNTESEPEIEILDEKHRKTGETLKCLKMLESYLTIPSEHKSNEDGCESSEKAMDQ